MKPVSYMAIVLCVMLLLTGCSSGAVDEEVNESVQNKTAVQNKTEPFTRNTKIEDVINAPSFDGFGRLLFPTDEYADEEIDGATYAQKMMELTSSAQNDND